MRLRPRVNRPDRTADGRVMAAAADQDKVLAAIIKWIPVEVIASYEFLLGVIPATASGFRFGLSVAFSFLLTPLWVGFASRDAARNEPIAWRQVILSSIAFVLWALGTQVWIGSHLFSDWAPWMGSVVLGLGALILPIGDGALARLGVRQIS